MAIIGSHVPHCCNPLLPAEPLQGRPLLCTCDATPRRPPLFTPKISSLFILTGCGTAVRTPHVLFPCSFKSVALPVPFGAVLFAFFLFLAPHCEFRSSPTSSPPPPREPFSTGDLLNEAAPLFRIDLSSIGLPPNHPPKCYVYASFSRSTPFVW